MRNLRDSLPRSARALGWLALGLWVLFALFPIYWLVNTSLKPNAEALFQPPTFVPQTFTVDAYEWAIGGQSLGALTDSLIITSAATVIAMVVGTMAGYAFSRWPKETGGRETAFFLLATRIFPPVAIALPVFFLYDDIGLLDTHLGLIILYTTFGVALATWLMRSFFNDVPRSYEEAAYLDGYGRFEAFRRVTLPLVAPGLIATTILTALFAWNEFLFALVIGGSEVTTYTALLPTLARGFEVEWARVSALSMLAMIPPLIMVIGFRRYLVRGMSLGAVKE